MRKVTIKDVAREAGVSIATVSRVINSIGFVSDEVKERVFTAARELQYLPNAIAKSLKQDKTNTIGVIIPDISNPFFMSISKGIEDIVYPQGYHLIFCSGNEDSKKEQQLLDIIWQRRVDAIVLVPSGDNEDMIEKIHSSGTPVILVDRKLQHIDIPLSLVAEDNFHAAYDLTNHLLQRKHERIGVINGPQNVSTGYDRYQGFARAMANAGKEINPQLIYDGDFTKQGGEKAVEYFLSCNQRPTAILSFSNMMSFGAILALNKNGISIPEEMLIASYGEVDAAQLLSSSGMIFVRQNPYEMGEKVGEIILENLKKDTEYKAGNYIFKPIIEEI